MGAPVIAAVIRMRDNEVVDDFRRAGALSPAAAQSLASIGIEHSMAVRRLHARAVIREASPGKFYLDEEVWTAIRRMRRRLSLMLVTIVVVIGLGLLFGIIKQ